ncbi:sulfurtransferase TusA family protein [Halorutilales archaeon Cl-col2-1]
MVGSNSVTLKDCDAVIDVEDEVCFMPIMNAKKELDSSEPGDLIAIKTGKPSEDCDEVESWVSKLDGGELVEIRNSESGVVAYIERL